MYKVLFSLLCMILIIVGVSIIFNQEKPNDSTKTVTITNPTVEEFLSEHPDADIVVYNDIVYIQAEDIDWVTELNLQPTSKKEFVITNQTTDIKNITNKTASTLPVGTPIYEPIEQHGSIYIAVVNGKEIRYLGLVEG